MDRRSAYRTLPIPEFRVPNYVWWVLAVVGLAVRVAFILKGNIGFNSDEAGYCQQIKNYVQDGFKGSEQGTRYSCLRFWMDVLYHHLTGGWVHFSSLAALTLSSIPCILWVLWVHRRVSVLASLALALFLAVPPAAVAYYSTHLDERRLETIFWGTLLVFFVGSWSKGEGRLLLFGGIMG